MNAKSALVIGLSSLVLLTGCMPKIECMCGYKKDYVHPYYCKSQCGPRISYRCDYICNRCSATEPTCSMCWSCINMD